MRPGTARLVPRTAIPKEADCWPVYQRPPRRNAHRVRSSENRRMKCRFTRWSVGSRRSPVALGLPCRSGCAVPRREVEGLAGRERGGGDEEWGLASGGVVKKYERCDIAATGHGAPLAEW